MKSININLVVENSHLLILLQSNFKKYLESYSNIITIKLHRYLRNYKATDIKEMLYFNIIFYRDLGNLFKYDKLEKV